MNDEEAKRDYNLMNDAVDKLLGLGYDEMVVSAALYDAIKIYNKKRDKIHMTKGEFVSKRLLDLRNDV